MDHLGVALREPGPILASAQSAPAGAPAGTGGGFDGGVVRPSVDLHAGGAAGTGLVLNDLMPLRQAPVTVPEFPRTLAWAAALVGLLALVLGLLGVGSSNPTPVLRPGSVTVAGHDPATSGRVSLNLNNQIPVVVQQLPSGVGTPVTAQLTLSLGGLTVVHSTSVQLVQGPSGFTATVDASSGRYIVGGKLAGSLKLTGPHGTVSDDFGVRATTSPFVTFGGVVGIVMLLVVGAYAESLLRTLRRGRRRDNRTAAVVGLAVVGVIGGLAATALGWMLEISAPTLLAFVLPAVIGGVAGVLAGLAGIKAGDRTRAQRQSRRLVLVARRSAVQPAPAGTG
jgi:serine/threonine-protein kinase